MEVEVADLAEIYAASIRSSQSGLMQVERAQEAVRAFVNLLEDLSGEPTSYARSPMVDIRR